MPKPNLTDANIEFEFTDDEAIVAKMLDPVKIAWYQTKYARIWKLRSTIPVPQDPLGDRAYFVEIAELDGRLGAIQDLMDDHKAAVAAMNARNEVNTSNSVSKTQEATAERASKLVNRIPTSI